MENFWSDSAIDPFETDDEDADCVPDAQTPNSDEESSIDDSESRYLNREQRAHMYREPFE